MPGPADARYSDSRATPSRYPGAVVKNTFLEFETEDDDPWLLGGTADRQKTDSLLDRRAAGMLRRELAAHSVGSAVGTGPAGSSRRPAPHELPAQAAELASRDPAGLSGLLSRHALPGTAGSGAWPRGSPAAVGGAAAQKQAAAAAQACGRGQQDSAMEHPPQQWQELSLAGERSTVSGGWFEDGTSEDTGSTFFPDHLAEKPAPPHLAAPGVWAEDQASPVWEEDQAVEMNAVQMARETAEAGRGLAEDITTVVIRNIPSAYTERQIIQEVDTSGFNLRYDFFYLPLDVRTGANRGFAFLNLVDPPTAQEFYASFHGRKLARSAMEDVDLAVLPADMQGFERNAEHYLSSRTSHGRRAPRGRPLFFRPIQPRLGQQREEQGNSRAARGANPGALRAQRAAPEAGEDSRRQQPGANPGALRAPRAAPEAGEGVRQQQPGPPPPKPSEARAPQPKFCAYCGKQKQADFAFCPYCGQPSLA